MMASERSNKHSLSDKKLDQAATAERDEKMDATEQGHDPEHIKKHNDDGKDRLFEGRQQHDDAEKNSEKTRLAKDVQRHHHPVDEQEADAGSSASAKRKS